MKQQCHIAFIFLSWIIYLGGMIFLIWRGFYVHAFAWLFFAPLFQWAYVHFFPKLSQYMGYGSIEDKPALLVEKRDIQVTLYTGLGCPFCPVVKERLIKLSSRMGFQVKDVDVTLKPGVLLAKGIRALPVIEVGENRLTGNLTSEQLARFIEGIK